MRNLNLFYLSKLLSSFSDIIVVTISGHLRWIRHIGDNNAIIEYMAL